MSLFDVARRPFPAQLLLDQYLREAKASPFPHEKFTYSAGSIHLIEDVLQLHDSFALYKIFLNNSNVFDFVYIRTLWERQFDDAPFQLTGNEEPEEKAFIEGKHKQALRAFEEKKYDDIYAVTRNIVKYIKGDALTLNIGSLRGKSLDYFHLIFNIINFLVEVYSGKLRELEVNTQGSGWRADIASAIAKQMSPYLEYLRLDSSLSAYNLDDDIKYFRQLKKLSVSYFPFLVKGQPTSKPNPLRLPVSLEEAEFIVGAGSMQSFYAYSYFQNLHHLKKITLVFNGLFTIRDIQPSFISASIEKTDVLEIIVEFRSSSDGVYKKTLTSIEEADAFIKQKLQ